MVYALPFPSILSIGVAKKRTTFSIRRSRNRNTDSNILLENLWIHLCKKKCFQLDLVQVSDPSSAIVNISNLNPNDSILLIRSPGAGLASHVAVHPSEANSDRECEIERLLDLQRR